MKESAGLLPFRRRGGTVEVFLTHPGGPFNARKNAWSITKGEVETEETPRQTMEREFTEETGYKPSLENLVDLGTAKSNGKTNYIWAVETDLDVSKFRCDSMVELEWPPKSGEIITFPENDKAGWIKLRQARDKVYKSQTVFIERLAAELGVDLDADASIGSDDGDSQPQIALDL